MRRLPWRDGHGDGPGAGVLPIAPADLTERHTEDHTAGDMFWWISNGMPSGAMPGVGDAITEEEKWEVINYIRALSSGYTGRYVPKRVIPRLAWLRRHRLQLSDGRRANSHR